MVVVRHALNPVGINPGGLSRQPYLWELSKSVKNLRLIYSKKDHKSVNEHNLTIKAEDKFKKSLTSVSVQTFNPPRVFML